MVCFPAGQFTRGTPRGESGNQNESPVAQISLDAFAIDMLEVTVEDYAICVASGLCTPRVANVGMEHPCSTEALHPATCVTWQQAVNYCESVDKRLPTEAEWERAARGTDGRFYPWSDADPTCARALFLDGTENCTGTPVAPVGDRSPDGDTPEGLSDMAGNAFEWTADWYDSEAYTDAATSNPTGPEDGDTRVIRGGSYVSPADHLRGARRVDLPPESASPAVGFRCAG